MIYSLDSIDFYPRKDGIDYPRKIDAFLAGWKENAEKKALLVKGLRQIGKSYALLKFGDLHYESVFYFDFRKHPDLSYFFADYDVNAMVSRMLLALPKASFVPGKTLIIFDEIQDCPKARGALKYFAIDKRYDVIGSGSMLGIKGYTLEESSSSASAGYESFFTMHPLDFEEFLWAYGLNSAFTDSLRLHLKTLVPIDKGLHEKMLSLFRAYIIIGGMPDAVLAYEKSKDFQLVRERQTALLESYQADFGRHVGQDGRDYYRPAERSKIQAVFDSLPSQLAKADSKFVYKLIKDQRPNGEKYLGPIQFLVDYGIVARCNNLTKIDSIQSGYSDPRSFKLYYADTGLFAASSDTSIAKAVLQDEYETFKGMVYENIVADGFIKMNRPLYYYQPNTHSEIDFVTTYKGKVALVETKAKKGATSSANYLLERFPNKDEIIRLKFSAQNIGYGENYETIPYYLLPFMEKEVVDSKVLNDLLPSLEELQAYSSNK